MGKVHESKLPLNANIVGGRFVHTLQNFLIPDEMAKVRYKSQGFAEVLKEMLFHDVTALRPASIRLILCIAAVLSLLLFSHDVTQEYLQANDLLTRLIFLRPKAKERALLGLEKGEPLKLLKPLYVLCDSGDDWNITIDDHLINDLQMERSVSDLSLYFRFRD